MIEIILVRHGETDWNVERRIQGNRDIPLNVEGRRQAAALGRALASEPLDAVIASDLRRAMETARAIAAPHGIAVRAERELRERRFGAFEGLTHDEIRARYPHHHAVWRARVADAEYPPERQTAETLRQFSARAVNAVVRLMESGFRKLLIVTHGGVLDCLYRNACGMDLSAPRNFDIPNAGINRLSWDGSRLQVMTWAETAHLNVASLDEIR